MSKIVSLTRERSPETRTVLITPGPLQYTRAEKNLCLSQTPPRKMDRSNEQIKQYVDAVEQIDEKEGVPVVNAWDAVWAAAGSRDEAALEHMYSDGLHLEAPGYKVDILTESWSTVIDIVDRRLFGTFSSRRSLPTFRNCILMF
jgi:lysophospholipase L1-like esterase